MKDDNPTSIGSQLKAGKFAIRQIDPRTDARWDRFVESHPYGWLTHLSSWREILVRAFPHLEGYCLALTDSSDGAILAALPVYEVKSWILGRRLVSIPFATLADPLITSAMEFDILTDALLDLAHELHVDRFEIRTTHASSLISCPLMRSQILYKHHCLALGQDPEELKSSFHRTCVRQRIAKALKSDLIVKIGKCEDDLKDLYDLYARARRRIGLPPQPYIFFKAIWETLYPENNVDLLLAELHGKTVAGLMLFKYKDRVSAEVAVADHHYRGISPNHLLFWEAIKRSTCEGYKLFDFGRTASSDHSLIAFKERWGTTTTDIPVYYFSTREAHSQAMINENLPSHELLKKVCRVTPHYLLVQIGQFCYRHRD